jgi:hypothetical protein
LVDPGRELEAAVSADGQIVAGVVLNHEALADDARHGAADGISAADVAGRHRACRGRRQQASPEDGFHGSDHFHGFTWTPPRAPPADCRRQSSRSLRDDGVKKCVQTAVLDLGPMLAVGRADVSCERQRVPFGHGTRFVNQRTDNHSNWGYKSLRNRMLARGTSMARKRLGWVTGTLAIGALWSR